MTIVGKRLGYKKLLLTEEVHCEFQLRRQKSNPQKLHENELDFIDLMEN